jgi:hypothetical protein
MQTRSFIGMDVHKETVSICIAEDGRNGPVRFLGDSERTRRNCCDGQAAFPSPSSSPITESSTSDMKPEDAVTASYRRPTTPLHA